jgi:hypothetical protein
LGRFAPSTPVTDVEGTGVGIIWVARALEEELSESCGFLGREVDVGVCGGWLLCFSIAWFGDANDTAVDDHFVCSRKLFDELFNLGEIDFIDLFLIREVGNLFLAFAIMKYL